MLWDILLGAMIETCPFCGNAQATSFGSRCSRCGAKMTESSKPASDGGGQTDDSRGGRPSRAGPSLWVPPSPPTDPIDPPDPPSPPPPLPIKYKVAVGVGACMLLAIGVLGYLFFTELTKERSATRWKRATSEAVWGEASVATYEFYPLSWLCLSEFDKRFLKCDTESELLKRIEEQRKYVLGGPAANELLDESAKLRTRRMLLRLKGKSEGITEDKVKFIRLAFESAELEHLFKPPNLAGGDKPKGERVLVKDSSLDKDESPRDEDVIWDPKKGEVSLWGELPWDREKIKGVEDRKTFSCEIKVEFSDGSQSEFQVEIVVHPVRQVEFYPLPFGFAGMIVESGDKFKKMVDDLKKEIDGLDTRDNLERIWEYLKKQGMKYQSHTGSDVFSQRVRHMEEVIEAKEGNCVELSVLLASLGAQFPFETGLYFTPGHCMTLVVVGGSPRYIESTQLGVQGDFQLHPLPEGFGYTVKDAKLAGVKSFEP